MINRSDEMALFVAAVEQGSLSGAARVTNASLASVSRHISGLEERLGVRLIVRSTRMLSLTDAGRRYYASAKRLLVEIDEMEASLTAEAATPVGPLRVTAPTLFGRVHMLSVLADFLMRNPRVTMDISLIDRPVNLMEEGIDLAVVVGEQSDSNLVARRLGVIRWVLSASPAYLAQRGVPEDIQALVKHDCLLYSQQNHTDTWTLMQRHKAVTLEIPVRVRSNTVDGVVAAAVQGAGIVLTPAWAVEDHVVSGRLQVVLPESEMPARAIYALMTHQRLLATKVRMLVEFLSAHFDNRKF